MSEPEFSGGSGKAHLRPATAAWWEATFRSTWMLDQHHERLLLLACEAYDRAAEAREALDEHGLTYLDRFGAPRTRPEVAVERDSRIGFARLLRDLDLDEEAPSSGLALRPYRRR
jgi:hypothetical protein